MNPIKLPLDTLMHDLDNLQRGYLCVSGFFSACQDAGKTYEAQQIFRMGHVLRMPSTAWAEKAPHFGLQCIYRMHLNDGSLISVWSNATTMLALRTTSANTAYQATLFTMDTAPEELLTFLRSFLVEHKEPRVRPTTEIHILAKGQMGYGIESAGHETHRFDPTNYHPDVVTPFRRIVKELGSKNPSGRLLLLDGEPGTGKTRYIRSVLAGLRNKAKVILVPPHLIADLSGPELVKPLLGNSGPILFVLEDADFALLSRDETSAFEKEGNTRALSALLNMTDGILGSVLDIRAIASTNAQLKAIDPALTRPGRLLARLPFGRLPFDQCVAVVKRETKGKVEELQVRMALSALPNKGENHHTQFATLAECYEVVRKLAGAVPHPRRGVPVRKNNDRPGAEESIPEFGDEIIETALGA